MKLKLFSYIALGILALGLITFTLFLYRENLEGKKLIQQQALEIIQKKETEKDKKIEALQNEIENAKKDENINPQVTTEDIVTTQPADSQTGRYCPALKECGNEYTTDYTCNNAICCSVDGVTMLSFAPWKCDDLYETVYLTSMKKTFRCKKDSVKSIERMDDSLEEELLDFENCMYAGNDSDYCKKYIPSAEQLDNIVPDVCIEQ